MLAKPLFINKFEKGQQENPAIGYGAMVGFDLYSKKGIAMLAKKTTNLVDLSSTLSFPHFFAIGGFGTVWWTQLSDGSVYVSPDFGTTWNTANFPDTNAGTTSYNNTHGNGLIQYQSYMFAFTPSKIYYTASSTPTAGDWIDWTTAKSLGALLNTSVTISSPIPSLHYPFTFPSQRGVYFGNASSYGVAGFFGQNGTTAFNPAGTAGTGFLYNNSAFSPVSTTYVSGPLNFLPPSNLAIGNFAIQEPASADLITWDTVSANKFNPPLRMPSAQQTNVGGTMVNAGVKQLVNRNQVLYAISGGNHTIYETNGSTFNLIESINLYSNVRAENGAETTLPPFFNSYPQAICTMGNKIFTGVSTPYDNSRYTTGGIFPMGIWCIAFQNDGTKTTQCEFPLYSPTVGGNLLMQRLVAPTGANSFAKTTCLFPIGNNNLLVGYAVKDANLSATAGTGIAMVETTKFIDDITKTAMESPLWEIGTALNPQAVNNIEVLLAKKLLTAQTIDISYRTSLADNWTALETFTGDGTKDYYQIIKNPIGATRYLQLRVRMATTSLNANDSPYLRNIIVS